MRVLKTATNKRKVQYALIQNDNTFGVYKLCENYAPHRKGGMSQTWRYVEKGMTLEAANVLFDRRTA